MCRESTGGLSKRERAAHTFGVDYVTYMGAVLGYLWPIILLCLTLSPYLVWHRALPCVHAHLLAKMDSSTRVSEELAEHIMVWSPSPRILFAHVSFGGLLDLKNEKYVVSLAFYPNRTQLLLAPAIIFILKYLSTGDRFQLLSLGPIYLLPQGDSGLLVVTHFLTKVAVTRMCPLCDNSLNCS